MPGINVTRDQVMDGMIAVLASVTAGVGNPVSPARYLYSAQRYMAHDFAIQEHQERGVVGRCPAARVAFVSERVVRTTIGRRRDVVDGTYGLYVAADDQRGRDSRKTLLAVLTGTRSLLGARALALGVRPLRYQSTAKVIDDDKLLVYLDTYTTRYRVDYTIDPGSDVIADAAGDLTHVDDSGDAISGGVSTHLVYP